MIVLCIVGTEEESGGDGAGEVSTGVESESVLRKRRPVVTGRLILFAGSPSIVFLRPAPTRVRVASCWRRRLMRLYFVLKEYYSSVTPRLLHVCDSKFPVLYQYSGDPSSSLIRATGHQLVFFCGSVVEEEKNKLLGPFMTG